MGIATDTRRLREDVAASHGVRTAKVSDLKKETSSMLAQSESRRKKEFSQFNRDLQSQQAERRRAVRDARQGAHALLQGFEKAHGEMARALRTELNESTSRRRSDVGRILGGFRKEREEARKEWRQTAPAEK